MSLAIIDTVLETGLAIVNRVWPDPVKQAEEQRKLIEMHQKGDLGKLQEHVKLMLAQVEVNKIDAKSSNFFQYGWRPSVGWVGSVSLCLMTVPKAIVMTYIWTKQSLITLDKWDGTGELVLPMFPDLGVTDIIAILTSLLGIAVMRSVDKKNKVDTK